MGLGSPPRLPKNQSVIARVKTPCIEAFFIQLERSWSVDVQNGLAWVIWTSAAQVMVKRRVGSQTSSWLLTIKSRESTRFWCVQGECDTPLESSRGELQLWFRPCSDPSSSKKLWASKVLGVQTGTISGLHFGSPEKKSHLDASAVEICKEYYMGEGGGFPRIRAVVSQVSPM